MFLLFSFLVLLFTLKNFTLVFTFHGSRYFTFLLVYCFIVLLCLVSVPLYLFIFTTKIENHHFSSV